MQQIDWAFRLQDLHNSSTKPKTPKKNLEDTNILIK